MATNESHAQVRLISICGLHARIVSAIFSREYLRFAYLPEISHFNRRVTCDVSVEDYQDARSKEGFLYLMSRISEVAVNAGYEVPKVILSPHMHAIRTTQLKSLCPHTRLILLHIPDI